MPGICSSLQRNVSLHPLSSLLSSRNVCYNFIFLSDKFALYWILSLFPFKKFPGYLLSARRMEDLCVIGQIQH